MARPMYETVEYVEENKYNKTTSKQSRHCRLTTLLIVVCTLGIFYWLLLLIFNDQQSNQPTPSSATQLCHYSYDESLYFQRNFNNDEDVHTTTRSAKKHSSLVLPLHIVTFHAGYRLKKTSQQRFGLSGSATTSSVESIPFPPSYHNWRMSLHMAGYNPRSITTLGEDFTWGLNEDQNWQGRTKAYLMYVESLSPDTYVVKTV